MEIKAGIVDDESKARALLSQLVKKYCPYIKVIFESNSAKDALAKIEEHLPDLLFLDVEMPEKNGLELLDDEKPFETIIITAYDQYAVDAFHKHASGYLVKPIVPEDFVKAVYKAVERIENKRNGQLNLIQNSFSSKIGISTMSGINFIEVEKILRCEGDSNYTTIVFKDGSQMAVTKTLKEFETILSPYKFCRVHKSHIINLTQIISYRKGEQGLLKLEGGDEIPVAQNRRHDLEQKLKVV